MLKSGIRKFLRVIYGKKIDKLSITDDKSVISFDLFDTLLIRTVGKPQNVFKQIGEEYECLCGSKRQFIEDRVLVEKNVRKKKGKEEILLDEIYAELKKTGYKNHEQLKQYEIETEIETCIPNKEVLAVFQEMVNLGKYVIIVSDMYLDRKTIETILNKCGIVGYKKLYVSSETGKTKRSGELFDYVINDINICPNNILHLGDHPISDYFMPRKKRMSAFLYKR